LADAFIFCGLSQSSLTGRLLKLLLQPLWLFYARCGNRGNSTFNEEYSAISTIGNPEFTANIDPALSALYLAKHNKHIHLLLYRLSTKITQLIAAKL
jgi:hypothetical protein